MIEVIYGLILVIFHYFNEEIEQKLHAYKNLLLSLSAGVSISYLFLFLFPELHNLIAFGPHVFITVLFGFSVFHIAEKHVYQHRSRKKILKELKEIHSLAFFIYHILLGITLYFFVQQGFLVGFVFFIPIFLHSTLSNISFSEMHEHVEINSLTKGGLALAPLIGVLLPTIFSLSDFVFSLILSFVVGALFYIVIRDSIPRGKAGNVLYFIFGIVIMLILVFVSGLI
ncbi:MAG: hypothetical protein Q8Q35_00355 [Nanoarchaeota archaeon]|nr:hypothetical protein [Nanoarchaeota archaeon]